ncbi:MAG: SAM-dependent methyltransferase [Nitrospiraceae bacterium]|nr:SAM-dependent methyltransferase [Nitrospiraceae bacterium]
MNAVKQKIIDKIRKDGPVTFKTFMKMVLFEPGFGYYTSEEARIGRYGDFYTSSHLHPIFGAMLGKQIEEMWMLMEKPDDFNIIEIGSGVGYLCKDILEYFSGVKIRGQKPRNIYKNIKYIIIEINPAMKEEQKKLLSEFDDKVIWKSSIKELSEIKGCILSNELLDSFPVHLIEMENGIKEIFIKSDGENLAELKQKPSTIEIINYLREFSTKLENGYRTETNLEIKKWLKEISEILKEGFILTIDYGYPSWDYYSEERNRGTLLCYYKHQISEDPYQNIGEQDITAHVNFSSVKKWAEELGIKTIGFCQQGAFLLGLGIDKSISNIYKTSSDYFAEIDKIKNLILPGTIGETHKVMIQYKGHRKPELKGFSIKNQLNNL